jgi:hypothetical protein
MAILSETTVVDKRFETMKAWSDAFFKGNFWHFIRDQHKIEMLSETEYLQFNRDKLIESGCKQFEPFRADPFDFSKIMTNQVIDPIESVI